MSTGATSMSACQAGRCDQIRRSEFHNIRSTNGRIVGRGLQTGARTAAIWVKIPTGRNAATHDHTDRSLTDPPRSILNPTTRRSPLEV